MSSNDLRFATVDELVLTMSDNNSDVERQKSVFRHLLELEDEAHPTLVNLLVVSDVHFPPSAFVDGGYSVYDILRETADYQLIMPLIKCFEEKIKNSADAVSYYQALAMASLFGDYGVKEAVPALGRAIEGVGIDRAADDELASACINSLFKIGGQEAIDYLAYLKRQVRSKDSNQIHPLIEMIGQLEEDYKPGEGPKKRLTDIYLASPIKRHRYAAGKELGYSDWRIFWKEHPGLDIAATFVAGLGLGSAVWIGIQYLSKHSN